MSPTLRYVGNYSKNGTGDDHGDTDLPIAFVWMALFASLLACMISLTNIYMHLRNYTKPVIQKSLVRILWIVPFYSIFSILILADTKNEVIYESIRDVWEAFVIHEFLNVVLAYCGGENACLQVISKHPGSIAHLWPMNYCFPRMPLTSRFMRLCKQFTLQFVLIKPVMAAVNIGMDRTGNIKNSSYQTAQFIIYNFSYTLALYGLVLFYMATHDHPALKSRHPLIKFASIKLVVFATYYQGLAVQLTPGFDRHYLQMINSFIICWEMVGFAAMHICAFGWFEYRIGNKIENEGGEGEGAGGTAASGSTPSSTISLGRGSSITCRRTPRPPPRRGGAT